VELRVRAATASDLAAVVGLYNHYVLNSPATFEVTPVTVEERSGWWAQHSKGGPHRLLVAEDDAARVVGWATTGPFRPRAAYATTVEASVYCRPEAVGQRVGTTLYDHLFRTIEGEDLERVVAGVTLPNPASLALHRRFGFRHVGTFTRIGRKFGRYWDVAWFERSLRHGAPALETRKTLARTLKDEPPGTSLA
jgi:phosphinothricin acetyltransferase